MPLLCQTLSENLQGVLKVFVPTPHHTFKVYEEELEEEREANKGEEVYKNIRIKMEKLLSFQNDKKNVD